MASVVVLGVAAVVVNLVITLVAGWDLAGSYCTDLGATDSFCNGVWWRTAVDYLPAWLIGGQIISAIALAFPCAIFRIGD